MQKQGKRIIGNQRETAQWREAQGGREMGEIKDDKVSLRADDSVLASQSFLSPFNQAIPSILLSSCLFYGSFVTTFFCHLENHLMAMFEKKKKKRKTKKKNKRKEKRKKEKEKELQEKRKEKQR